MSPRSYRKLYPFPNYRKGRLDRAQSSTADHASSALFELAPSECWEFFSKREYFFLKNPFSLRPPKDRRISAAVRGCRRRCNPTSLLPQLPARTEQNQAPLLSPRSRWHATRWRN